MLTFAFFFSLAGLVYVYVGYPLIVWVMGKVCPRSVDKHLIEPSVTILIAAFNEAASIGETIANKLDLDYPPEKLEIIVVSDGSNDGTDALVEGFSGKQVRLIRQEPRAGKTSALNLAVPLAHGEILVFSDANSIYAPGALRCLVANFADPRVGYVTGKMIYANPGGTLIGDGCSNYMKYENFIRSAETRVGSVVGVDGGIDAIRKTLYQPMNNDQLPDFVQPLKVVEQGFRVVYEPNAVLVEQALNTSGDEYRMRVRVTLRALWALNDMRHLLFFRNNPLFSWQLWSHKVLRYFCFIFLISAFVSNFMLLGSGLIFTVIFIFQCVIYCIALITPWLERKGINIGPFGFFRYFVLLNFSCIQAFGKFLLRRKQITWTPRKG